MATLERQIKAPSRSLRLANLFLEALNDRNAESDSPTAPSLSSFYKQLWWNGLEKYGFVTLRHEVYEALLEAVNGPLLEDVGRRAGRELAAYLLRKYEHANIEVLLDYVLTMASQFGLGRIRTEQKGVKYVITMYHKFGKRHSIFMKAIWDSAVVSIAGFHPKTEISDTMVMSELEIIPISLHKLA